MPATSAQRCLASTPSLGESPFSVRMIVLAVPPSRGAKRKQNPPNPFLPSDGADDLHRLVDRLEAQREIEHALRLAAGRWLHAVHHDLDIFLDELAIAVEPAVLDRQPAPCSPLVSCAFQRTNRCWNPLTIQMSPLRPSTVTSGHIQEMPRWCG